MFISKLPIKHLSLWSPSRRFRPDEEDGVLEMKYPYTLILIFLMILLGCDSLVGDDPTQEEADKLLSVEIEYISPHFENSRLIWHQVVNRDTIRNEMNAGPLMTISLINDTSNMPRNPLNTDSTYFKHSIVTVENDTHAFTALGWYIEDLIVQGHNRSDIVMWEKGEDGFTPVKIYPEAIGGCLYCRVGGMTLKDDTLNIPYRGRDVEDTWGGEKLAVISGDSIYLHRLGWLSQSNYISGYTPGDIYGNPVPTASHSIWHFEYYNRVGELLNRKLVFDAWYPDGRKVYLNAKSDTLTLYDPLIPSPCQSCPPFLFVKTINVGTDSIRVGPVQNHNILHIAVYWENRWFFTLDEQIDRP